MGIPLDRPDHAAQVVQPTKVLQRRLFETIREAFDIIGAAQGIDAVGDLAFLRNDLLRAQRQFHRALGRQRERFVH